MPNQTASARSAIAEKLLWIDCLAGGIVGLFVLTFSGWLSELYGLPRQVLLFTGVANLVYASFSFSLAVRRERPLSLLYLLIVANAAWVPVCFGLAVTFLSSATAFGVIHLAGEGVFVGGLAALEWSFRGQLRERP